MSADMNIRLELQEIELPVGPGSIVRVLVAEGVEPFFGDRGIRMQDGFAVKVNDDLWRGLLTSVTRDPSRGGVEMVLTIQGRYGQT